MDPGRAPALLLCLNVLLFVFAAWNLVAVRHIGMSYSR